MKNKKLISFIIILITIMTIIPGCFNASYAADKASGTLSRDINDIDDNIYPGYKSLIKNMQSAHPNYTFLVYYTGMEWNEVLTAEYQGHGYSPLNLTPVSDKYNGMWICPICGNKSYDNGSWCCASLESLAYMMDPRNSINDSDIFQFKDLEGSDVSYADIARVVSKYGSYLNNAEAVQAILDASVQYNINGYFLVAKILNEHGANGSTLSNGKGYNGKFAGVYNYFNIGSFGNGSSAIINSGLTYAQNAGWTSIRASIMGGAAIVKTKYITDYSQCTLYYQKFNVSGKSSMASHQYQQNIMAAQSQGSSLKAYYSNLSGNHTFIIPLYKNIPANISARPNVSVKNTITYENGVVQNVSNSIKVRASGNGTVIGALNNGESIKILKRATNPINNYYWDLVVSNKDGTYGYAARNVGGDICIASTGSSNTNSGSSSTTENVPQNNSTNNNSNNADTNTNTSASIDYSNSIKIKESYINLLPNITCENLKVKYPEAIVKNQNGTVVTNGNLGTGFSITIGENTYKIVKKGDTNGDGMVSVVDAVNMLNAVKGNKALQNEYKEAALLKNSTNFDVTDIVFLLNYIKGTSKIELK